VCETDTHDDAALSSVSVGRPAGKTNLSIHSEKKKAARPEECHTVGTFDTIVRRRVIQQSYIKRKKKKLTAFRPTANAGGGRGRPPESLVSRGGGAARGREGSKEATDARRRIRLHSFRLCCCALFACAGRLAPSDRLRLALAVAGCWWRCAPRHQQPIIIACPPPSLLWRGDERRGGAEWRSWRARIERTRRPSGRWEGGIV
jgi:hypothetical protein